MREKTLSRRQALEILGALTGPGLVQGLAQGQQLPLKTTGLEHISMTVPDPEATAKFYGLIFNPQLFKITDPAPGGFFVMTGISYISIPVPNTGAATGPPRIDHFCALVQDYNQEEMGRALQNAGVRFTTGPLGGSRDPVDPDGLRLQVYGVPGGFLVSRTYSVVGPRISQDYPVVQAIGIDHAMLAVSDLDKSAAHYAKLFGKEVARTRKPERVWFGAAKTRLGLQLKAPGSAPAVDHVCFKVAGFDRRVVTERLKDLRVDILPNNDEDVLRFRDPNGLLMELKG